MAPKTVKYNTNSIIYFKGDRSNSIYVLKKGSVSLNYKDLQTGQEVQDLIKTGEFFGVKAALGHYTHDETAVVVVDSEVVQFSVSEFEALLKGNIRLILKMLKVFSTQLRRIHRQVQGLLSSDLSGNPELGLFEIGEYYRKQKDYKKSIAAYKRYKELHPRGYYIAQVEKALESVDEGTFFQNRSDVETEESQSVFVYGKHIERGNYQAALKGLTHYLQSPSNDEERPEAEYLLGVCLFKMGKIKECLSQLTGTVKKYPKHGKLGEVLFYLGMGYGSAGDTTKAAGFMSKSVSMLSEDSTLLKEGRRKLSEWKDTL